MTIGGASPFSRTDETPLAGRTVLQIIANLEGGEQAAIETAAALTAAGARALVAAAGGRLVSELQANGGLYVPFPAGEKNPLVMALNVGRLIDLIRREGVDVVHARSRPAAWVAYAATRRTRTPFITSYNGHSTRSALKLQYDSVMARGDVVIAQSQYVAGLVGRLYPFARDHVRVVSRGIDFRTFSAFAVDPARVRRLRLEWGIASDERIVLVPTRLSAWKGQRLAIEALRRLATGVSHVRYVLAAEAQGRARHAAELDALIAATGLAPLVRRIGHIGDLPAALLAAAVVVVPAGEPEAFARVAIEAQAMGTPVVAVDLGAASEMLLAPPRVRPEQRTGWCVPAGDAEALAEAIGNALDLGAAAREALAVRARAHVEGEFSLDRMKREMLDLYSAVLERRGAPARGLSRPPRPAAGNR